MSLDSVKQLTGDNPQIDVIYEMVTRRLATILKDVQFVDKALVDLEYIIDEVTIVRFNRIGSEGMKSETVEGHRVEFNHDDPFLAYADIIQQYIDENTEFPTSKRVVRFK